MQNGSKEKYDTQTNNIKEDIKVSDEVATAVVPGAPEKKKSSKKKALLFSVIGAAASLITVVLIVAFPTIRYSVAVSAMDKGNFEKAISIFEKLDDYRDSTSKIIDCKYEQAILWLESGKITDARREFIKLDDYKDSVEQIKECDYQQAIKLMEEGKLDKAEEAFGRLADYKDCDDKIIECKCKRAVKLMDTGKLDEALQLLNGLGKNSMVEALIEECKYQQAIMLYGSGKVVEAYEALIALGHYKDSAEKAESIQASYNQIKSKDYIFRDGTWWDVASQRCVMTTKVIDEMTMKIHIHWSSSAWISDNWDFIGQWDSQSGRLYYVNGSMYTLEYDESSEGEETEERVYAYQDGSGYFYYEDDYMYWVAENDETSKDCYFEFSEE